jgi:hypothetical protein
MKSFVLHVVAQNSVLQFLDLFLWKGPFSCAFFTKQEYVVQHIDWRENQDWFGFHYG